uniref:Uncharacterized protein n=1 Tax=Rhizophora mucronata TaxID=61149 RepID=A0A2P2QJN4_RHIMU
MDSSTTFTVIFLFDGGTTNPLISKSQRT